MKELVDQIKAEYEVFAKKRKATKLPAHVHVRPL